MKKGKLIVLMTVIFSCLLLHVYGQGTKISAFPLATAADANTTLAGIQYISGSYINQRYSMAQLAAYIKEMVTFDQTLANGNATGRNAYFSDGGSNLTIVDHGSISLYGLGHNMLITPGTLYVYNNSGGYSLVTSGTNPAVGMSNVSGTQIGYIEAPTVTNDRIYRMPDSSGTVALLDNLSGFLPQTLSSGNMFLGNSSNVATAVTASGDATISNTGVITVDSTKFATRLRVQKVVDSLNALGHVTSVATGYGLSGGPITTSGTINTDTSLMATRLRVQKGIDSLGGDLKTLANGKIFVGNVSNIETAVSMSGDAIISNTGNITLKNTGVAGTYGDATHIPSITTDAQGRVSAVTTYTVTGGGGNNIANASLTANNDYIQHWNKKKLFFDSTRIFAVTDTAGDTLLNLGMPYGPASPTHGRFTSGYDALTGNSLVNMYTRGGNCGITAIHLPASTNYLYNTCASGDYTYMTSQPGAAYYEMLLGGIQIPVFIDSGSKLIRLQDDTIQMQGTVQIMHLTGYNNTNTTIAAGTGAGTSSSISISGDDLGGYIALTTGTSPVTSATVATITFSKSYYATPRCVILSPADSNSSALNGTARPYVRQPAITTTSFAISAGATALAASTTYKWYYYIKQ